MTEPPEKRLSKVLPEPITRAPKPPHQVGGGGGVYFRKPSQVPTGFPPDYPRSLQLKTQVVLAKTVNAFPDRSRLEQLCKELVSKLTPLFCAAVREGALRADDASDRLNKLLHYVRVANCEWSNTRFEIEKAVKNSDEWRSLIKRLVKCEDLGLDRLSRADLGKNASPTRKRIDAFITNLFKAGHTIKRKDIWRVAGYTDRTEFERFQREDKRVSSGTAVAFNRVLNMSPEAFMNKLTALSPK